MADWWSPLISAAAGLTGVWVGSSLTLARERKQRQYDFARRQLEEFYSPFCALREEIRAKGEIRAQGSSDERTPTLERSIEYDNEQLRREISPTFKPALLESGGEGWAYPSWSTSRRPGIRHARFT